MNLIFYIYFAWMIHFHDQSLLVKLIDPNELSANTDKNLNQFNPLHWLLAYFQSAILGFVLAAGIRYLHRN